MSLQLRCTHSGLENGTLLNPLCLHARGPVFLTAQPLPHLRELVRQPQARLFLLWWRKQKVKVALGGSSPTEPTAYQLSAEGPQEGRAAACPRVPYPALLTRGQPPVPAVFPAAVPGRAACLGSKTVA